MSTDVTATTDALHPAVARALPFELVTPPELPDLLHGIAEMLKGHPCEPLELELRPPTREDVPKPLLHITAGLQRWSMKMGLGHFILQTQIFDQAAPASWGLLNYVTNHNATLIFHRLGPPLSMEYVSSVLNRSAYFMWLQTRLALASAYVPDYGELRKTIQENEHGQPQQDVALALQLVKQQAAALQDGGR